MMPDIRKIEPNNEIDKLFLDRYTSNLRKGYVEVGPDNVVMPTFYEKYREQYENFEVRDSDVFVIGQMKTGTTWAQEMVWMIANNCNYERAKTEDVYSRILFYEMEMMYDVNEVNFIEKYDNNLMAYIKNLPSPRCFKTHSHWSLLPKQLRDGSKKPKIITILRNAEDTCVSLYHHSRMADRFTGSFEEMCQLFRAGRIMFGPYWKSILSVWKERHRSNILFVKYADMKNDMPGVIKKVAQFLEREINDEEVARLAQHLSFNSMKENPAVNMKDFNKFVAEKKLTIADNDFIRKGVVGGYKTEMTDKQIEEFKEWTKKELEGTGLEVE